MQCSAPPRFRSARRAVATVAAALVIVGPMALQGARIPAAAQASPPPNIVLLLTDDQRPSQVAQMPRVRSLLQSQGVNFDRAFTPDPLCCPSRISTLRGQSSQRTGVWAVSGKFGGFGTVRKLGLESSTAATWLQGAGYRTALVGKYLNGYTTPDAGYVPPGWDYWRGMTRIDETAANGGYYNYGVSENGVERLYGATPSDYSTSVLTSYAHDFITGTPVDQPLFLDLAFRAPHRPSTPSLTYATDPRCASVTTNTLPGFNEQDVTDKPNYIRAQAAFTPTVAKQSGILKPQKACRALLSVDDAVGSVMADLQATGRLANTLVIFTSDNGILFGEHRWQGKKVPYVESNHVPFIVRYDPLTAALAGTTDHAMVQNLDLASTWAQVAGVVPPIPQDGASLIPLLDGTSASWRTDILLEAFDLPKTAGYVPGYCGLETDDGWVYIHYDAATETRNEELYDLNSDPAELNNLAYDPVFSARRQTLLTRVRALCDPGPPGFSW